MKKDSFKPLLSVGWVALVFVLYILWVILPKLQGRW